MLVYKLVYGQFYCFAEFDHDEHVPRRTLERVVVGFVRGEGRPCVAKRHLATVETNDPSVRALASE